MSNNPNMDDLLGAYALDAVDDDERRLVEDYLASNPRARAEVQQHRDVATYLAWSGADAPDGLWDRIAGSIEGGDDQVPEFGQVLPMRASRRSWSRTAVAWLAATAAAALIAVVAVRVSDDNQGSTASGMDKAVAEAMADPDSVQAQLTSVDDETMKVRAVVNPDGIGYLLADSLPELDDTRTYQLWGQVEGNPDLISLGVLGSRPETSAFTVDGTLTLLAITDEVAGGVTSSSNPVVVAGVPT